jgi:hypothetical protein
MRLILVAAATAAAMLIKNTAVILLVVLLVAGLMWIWVSPVQMPGALRRRFNSVGACALLTCFFLWAFTGFNFAPPKNHGRQIPTTYGEDYSFIADVVNPALARPFPAGIYVGSLCEMYLQSRDGVRGFLLGEFRNRGWWYYFPVVATYKVPIGVSAVLLAGVISLWLRPPRRWELWLAVPMLAWTAIAIASTINIGFRHFLPAYVFMLMLASRSVATTPNRAQAIVAWLGLAAAALHAASYHPDYLSYINFPRDKPHLAISDSNVDRCQSIKQIEGWLSEHPELV